MTSKKIAIYGSGAFGQEIFLLIKLLNDVDCKIKYEFLGFFDDVKPKGSICRYGNVLGNFEDINQIKEPLNIAIAVGSPKDLISMGNKLTNSYLNFPNLISPTNLFFDKNSCVIGKGNIILSSAIISNDVKLGDFNILNTRVGLGHSVEIGSFNVLNPNVQLSGDVKIGNYNNLGLNSALLPKKYIGDSNVVTPGSIVTRNFKNNNFLAGNPAINIKL